VKVTYDMHRSLHPSLKSETEFDYSEVVETREKKGFFVLFLVFLDTATRTYVHVACTDICMFDSQLLEQTEF